MPENNPQAYAASVSPSLMQNLFGTMLQQATNRDFTSNRGTPAVLPSNFVFPKKAGNAQDLSTGKGDEIDLGKNLNGDLGFDFNDNPRIQSSPQSISSLSIPQSVTSNPNRTQPDINPNGFKDISGGEKGKFGIHDAATIFNLGMAVRNLSQSKPGRINLQEPTANKIQKNTKPITDAEDKGHAQINAGTAAARSSQKGVGATLAASSLGNAARLRLSNNVGSQISQYTTGVDNANAQIGNQVSAQRAQIANQETQLNTSIQQADAAQRGQAVTSNVQSAFQNQIQKKQEVQWQKQADFNRMVQVEAVKSQQEQSALASKEYGDFELKRQQEIQAEVLSEMGDADDLTNPIYKDALTGSEEAFNKEFKGGDNYKNTQEKIAKIQARIDGSEEGVDTSGFTSQIDALNTGLEGLRETGLEGFQGNKAKEFYKSELQKRWAGKNDKAAFFDEYRKIAGIEKSNLGGLLKFFDKK